MLSSVGAITVLANRSQNKQNTLPPKKHAGIIKIGFVLERNCFAKCGTAIPTKEIGPANATIQAERMLLQKRETKVKCQLLVRNIIMNM